MPGGIIRKLPKSSNTIRPIVHERQTQEDREELAVTHFSENHKTAKDAARQGSNNLGAAQALTGRRVGSQAIRGGVFNPGSDDRSKFIDPPS